MSDAKNSDQEEKVRAIINERQRMMEVVDGGEWWCSEVGQTCLGLARNSQSGSSKNSRENGASFFFGAGLLTIGAESKMWGEGTGHLD